ncbi:MAG TPA: calcium/sodium antiporter [Cyclobacteriaceae bacterium]|nr:calcium/sodium antiporter [Cyclobacteriaceae bacterium]
MLIILLLLFAGFAILIKGADFLVSGASSLAKKLDISNIAIGLTVVAFGTSTPELVVSVISSVEGKSDATFGNVIGSNNFNLLFILGVAGIICPLVVQRSTIKYEIPLSLIAPVVLYLLVNDHLRGGTINQLTRIDSLVLLFFFGLFLVYVFRTMKKANNVDPGEEIKVYSTMLSIGFVMLGLAMLVGGGKLVVDNAIKIAVTFGLSEKLIGLTILAAGTSLPELATTAVAAYKKNSDIAVGNVVGSNIFNIFFILGISGFITPGQYNIDLNFDLMICGIVTILLILFMFTLHKNKLDRWEAIVLLFGYFVYTIYVIRQG